jgi:hypothetical protein
MKQPVAGIPLFPNHYQKRMVERWDKQELNGMKKPCLGLMMDNFFRPIFTTLPYFIGHRETLLELCIPL